MPIVAPTINAERMTIARIRRQCKAIIDVALDNQARVHSSWKLKADMSKNISIFQRKSDQKIYSWMIGTESNLTNTNQNGDYEFIGARKAVRAVKLILWGFYDYQLFDADSEMESQEFIENETELIADYFAANPRLGFDADVATSITKVQPFQMENLDVHSFTDGVDAHVAQCTMRIFLTR